MICKVCNGSLQDRQKIFCSKICANKFGNEKYQNYNTQREKGFERKCQLIEKMGGQCNFCGYNRNFAVLQFHHIKPSIKKFNIDIRKLSNGKWLDILEESEKCILLCANCHGELHNPQHMM